VRPCRDNTKIGTIRIGIIKGVLIITKEQDGRRFSIVGVVGTMAVVDETNDVDLLERIRTADMQEVARPNTIRTNAHNDLHRHLLRHTPMASDLSWASFNQ
jgi:hypothetical protein